MAFEPYPSGDSRLVCYGMLTVKRSRLMTLLWTGATSALFSTPFFGPAIAYPQRKEGGNMGEPKFDIFRGAFDKNAVRVEVVSGFANACRRMREIAQAKPERYFVYCLDREAVLARIDTRTSVVIPFRPRAAGASG